MSVIQKISTTSWVLTLFLLQISISAESKKYLSKNEIDGSIQEAFYQFNAAAGSAINKEAKQKGAIAYAKGVVKKLTNLSKNDPNWAYIAWRISELQQQIQLEEEEIYLNNQYKHQNAINILVSNFNREIGKSRPNFANLVIIQEKMSVISPNKGNELIDFIENRRADIADVMMNNISINIEEGRYDKAFDQFQYVRKYRQYLSVSAQRFNKYASQIQNYRKAQDLKENFRRYENHIKEIVQNNRFAEAHRHISVLEKNVTTNKALLGGSGDGFLTSLSSLRREIESREDVLVSVNLQYVNRGDLKGAISYLDRVVRKSGISLEKIRRIDQEILKMPGGDAEFDDSLNSELSSLTNNSGTSFGLTEIQARLQEKVKKREDSIQAYNDSVAQVLALLEQQRQDSLAKLQASVVSYETTEASYKTSSYSAIPEVEQPTTVIYESTNHSQQHNNVAQNTENTSAYGTTPNEQKAEIFTNKIYKLLEDGNIDLALQKFNKYYVPLKKYSPDIEFSNLEQAVMAANAHLNMQTYNQNTTANTTPQTKVVVQTTPTSNNALSTMDRIYTLLENNQINSAYTLFASNYQILKNGINGDAFQSLEMTITHATASIGK